VRRKYNVNKKKRRSVKIIIFLLAIFLVFFYIVLHLQPSYWRGNTKLGLAISRESGSIVVAVFDPTAGTINVIDIPKETEVEVSRNLGKWRTEVIRELGENEGLNGKLVSETMTRGLLLPTEVWADEPAMGFIDSGIGQLFHAVFDSYDTNLNFGDKVRLAIFSLRVTNSNKNNVSLVGSGYLVKTELVGGESGFVTRGNLPSDISAIFEIPNDFAVNIIDNTATPGVVNKVTQILEVLGIKVSSIPSILLVLIWCYLSNV